MISYLQPNSQLTAARWNDVFAQAEAVLGNALGGLSAVFAGVDKQWDRGFFFFNPQNPPTNLHPVAASFLTAYLGNIQFNQRVMFWRQYNHSAITGLVAGLSQSSNSTKWQAVNLALPTWTAWLAAVYPSGFGGNSTQGMTQTISSVVYPVYNCLDVSLAVIKVNVSSTPYNVTFNDVMTVEHAQPYKPIDVFINGNLSWDSAWDKYSVVRVHNCARSAATATFGSASATLPAGSSKCFRKISSGWIACGNYFHTMQTGDGRFIQMREAGNPSNNGQTGGSASIFMPGIVADVIAATLGISTSNFSKQADATQFFDLSAIYNNAGYTPSPGEKTPPANGYFPALADSDLLGDLIIHRGKVLVANRTGAHPVNTSMTNAVVMTLAVPAPTWNFVDGSNTIVSVSNVSVYNQTTGQSIPQQSNSSDPATTNWQVSGTQIAIIPRGSYWTGSAWAPITPTPYAPYISQGDVLVVSFTYIPPDDHVWVDFDSFSSLATKLQAAGLSTRALSQSNPAVSGATLNNLEIYNASSWHLVDLSCPLVTFLTGGTSPLPAVVVGSTQSSNPKSLALPWLMFGATACVNNPSSSNFYYYQWQLDANGNPVLGSYITVTVNNAGSTATQKSNMFLPTDAVSTVESWISSTSQAGGILSIGNFQLLSTPFQLLSTPFGHVLLWDEIWPLDAKFTAVLAWTPPNYSGNVRTIKIVHEWTVGLHVTRAIFLNETKYFGGYGSGNENPWEHGVFPPIGSAASRFLFWNFARIDRQFENPRWYQHLSADSPWMPNTGWSNQKFASGLSGLTLDELSTIEFNHVQSFYEFAPVGVDTVVSPTALPKTGISRMGTFATTADIWTPFAYWLAKVPNLTYSTGSGTSSIVTGTGSGWYYPNTSSVMTNATISNPIPNLLCCQSEHFNSLASLLNSQPAMRYAIGRNGSTAFTLNFAAGNILIVNGDSGFTVGQALNFNLKVASVDSNGAITGVAQNGSVVVNTYDAYSTPMRPFALGGNATCDTSVGDGSALSFIPTYAPTGVQTPMLTSQAFYGWFKIFPRNCYFSWNGPTSGGADPVGSYLTGLGMGVQATLPDSYGNTILNKYGNFTNGSYVTHDGTSTDWCQGFTPAFKTSAQTYRWVTIDEARTLYGNFSLPFVLNANFAPMSFNVVESSQDSYTLTTPDTKIAEVKTPQATNPPLFSDWNGSGYLDINPLICWGDGDSEVQYQCAFDGIFNGYPITYGDGTNGGYEPRQHFTDYGSYGSTHVYQNIPHNTIVTTSNIGDFVIKSAEFINDAGGGWLCDAGASTLCSSQFLLNDWNKYATRKQYHTYTDTIKITGNFTVTSGTGIPSGGITVLTWEQWRHTDLFTYEDNWGILNPIKFGTQNATLVCRAYLAEGLPDQLVAAVPQNYAYRDPQFVRNQQVAYDALGLQVIPYIADSSVELSEADIQIFPGAGGVGNYDHVMTTQLSNARLVQVPVDGQIGNPNGPGGGL